MHERSSKNPHSPTPTANERWKDRYRLRMVCSGVGALILHASVFVLWPAGAVEDRSSESPLDALELLQVARTSAEPSGSSAEPVPVPAAPVVRGADSTGSGGEEDASERGDQPGREIAGMSKSLFDRIRERAPAPSLVEREPRPETQSPDEASAAEEEVTAGNDDPTTTGVPDMLELSDVELERLTAVRPELVLTAPAGWVTVKNPTDVRRFMKRMYNRGVMDPDASGSVSVALWIDEEGRVEWAEITDSSGRDDLDRIALSLFQEVVSFWPAREEGAPVPTSAIFSVVFPWP